jgi:hypothetical protein
MSAATKELILIGTVHGDPDGATRLRRLLEREQPLTVAVEVSPYGLSYRRRNGRFLRKRLRRVVKRLSRSLENSWQRWGQVRAIQAQLLVPFEFLSAQRYCRDSGASLYCLDCSSWSRQWIHSHWHQLISRENVAALFRQEPEDLREQAERSYGLAASLLSDVNRVMVSAFSRGWSVDTHWQKREAELTRGVKRLYGGLRRGRLAYVGGWQHLLSPTAGSTLYERLERLRPRRVLLSDG